MSQAEPQPGDAERTVDKTVQVVGYLADQSYVDWREYADDHDDDVDYYEKKERENSSFFLTGFGEEIEITEEQYRKFGDNNIGLMSLRKEVDTDSRWVRKPRQYVSDVRSMIMEAILADIDDVFETKYGFRNDSLEHKESDCEIHVYRSCEVLGMLKHQSEATEEDLFENNENLMAMKFRISITDATPELLEWIDENFTSKFIQILSKSSEIDKVRIYDCEQETTEKGVCFNI